MAGDPKLSRIVVPIDDARWYKLHTDPCDTDHAIARLQMLGLDEIRTRLRVPEDEVAFISKDPEFRRSARIAYLSARDRDGGRIFSRGPPRSLTLTFHAPGTWEGPRERGEGNSP